MWAVIHNNTVVEVTDIDPKGRFVDAFATVACPEDTKRGYRYEDGVFKQPSMPEPAPPPTPTPEELARQRMAEIHTRLTAIDLETLRPLRAKSEGTASAHDLGKLARLEVEAQTLRAELAKLEAKS